MSMAQIIDEPTAPIQTYDTPLPIVGEPWFIVRTAPSYVDALRCMAIDAECRLWSPVYARRTRVGPSKKRAVVHAPIFPGYAFVPRSQAHRLRSLPTHRYQFLRMPSLWGVEFVKLPWHIISEIGEQERRACLIEPEPRPADRFAVGDMVQTVFGPLEVRGFVGQTLRLEAGRFKISIDAAIAESVA